MRRLMLVFAIRTCYKCHYSCTAPYGLCHQIHFVDPYDPKLVYVNGGDCPQNPKLFYLNSQYDQFVSVVALTDKA